MHDFLVLISRIQALLSLRSLAVLVPSIAILALLAVLWQSADPLGRAISIGGFWVILSVALSLFLRQPIDWAVYLCRKAGYLLLAIVRLAVKGVVWLAFVAFSLVYIISPFDFIPDFLLLLGWIDDALLALAIYTSARSANLQMPEISFGESKLGAIPRFIASGCLAAALLYYVGGDT